MAKLVHHRWYDARGKLRIPIGIGLPHAEDAIQLLSPIYICVRSVTGSAVEHAQHQVKLRGPAPAEEIIEPAEFRVLAQRLAHPLSRLRVAAARALEELVKLALVGKASGIGDELIHFVRARR